jgi:hypothetical protein
MSIGLHATSVVIDIWNKILNGFVPIALHVCRAVFINVGIVTPKL